jgi:asparagine synthetase B (glutamine-hydrolysing)
MFALALYDERVNEVICIRDRAGVKPFSYYWKDDVFIFGSELKSITGHPAFEKEIDRNAVASFCNTAMWHTRIAFTGIHINFNRVFYYVWIWLPKPLR